MSPELYDFQRAGVRFLVTARRAMLGDDMGLGKTAQAIIACEEQRLRRVLVICPNTLKGNWAAEVVKWAPERLVSVLRGGYTEREAIIKSFEAGYLVANVESVRRPSARRAAGYGLIGTLLAGRWDALILDEAHVIKNRGTGQTEGVRRLAKCIERVYLLTGTPIMNRVDELWSPLHVLYPRRYPSYWSFVKEHATAYPGRFGWVVDGKPTRPDQLRRELGAVFLRREKEEVFPAMPRKVYQRVWLDMEGEQLRIYRDIERQAMAEIDADTTVTTPCVLAQLTRCRQVTVSPALIGGRPDGVKLDALMDVAAGTGQKMLVFSQFAEAIKLAARRFEEAGIGHVTFTGETKEVHRDEAVKRFQEDPETRAFLATTQAGGSGLTLTAASLVVFLDKCWTPAANEQAVDRTRPHMQNKPVQVVELVCRNTVDEVVEAVLAGKVNIIEAVLKRKKEISTWQT